MAILLFGGGSLCVGATHNVCVGKTHNVCVGKTNNVCVGNTTAPLWPPPLSPSKLGFVAGGGGIGVGET